MAGLTVLDASVLIAHFNESDEHHARARRLLDEVIGRGLAASVVTLAEVLVTPARRGLLDTARAGLDALGIEEVPVGSDAPARLAALRLRTGLKLPDWCVVLAAQDWRAHAVATFDERLSGAARELGYATPA